jgi:hypothetical protein
MRIVIKPAENRMGKLLLKIQYWPTGKATDLVCAGETDGIKIRFSAAITSSSGLRNSMSKRTNNQPFYSIFGKGFRAAGTLKFRLHKALAIGCNVIWYVKMNKALIIKNLCKLLLDDKKNDCYVNEQLLKKPTRCRREKMLWNSILTKKGFHV